MHGVFTVDGGPFRHYTHGSVELALAAERQSGFPQSLSQVLFMLGTHLLRKVFNKTSQKQVLLSRAVFEGLESRKLMSTVPVVTPDFVSIQRAAVNRTCDEHQLRIYSFTDQFSVRLERSQIRVRKLGGSRGRRGTDDRHH